MRLNTLSKFSVAVAAFVLAQPPILAVTEVLAESDIAYALNIANGSEGTRSLFHAPYVVVADATVGDVTIEQLDVITEFRRFVLAAEDQATAGNWMMARGGFNPKGQTLKDLLQPSRGQVSIRSRLRFHPFNSYVTLPAFDILLGEPTLLAINAIRTPYITPASGERNTRDIITGATIEVFFNAPTIGDRTLPVRIVSEGKELVRRSVDFSRVK